MNLLQWLNLFEKEYFPKPFSKEYHNHNFNQFLEVLRKTQELLENQFTKSMAILEPLKAAIKTTDELIDEIVYRLYGLSEDEIKVVKGEDIK